MRTDALRKFDVDPRSLSGSAKATVAVGGGGGAGGDAATVGGYPASAFLSPSYLVVGWDPNLTNERVLLAGNGLSSLDGGANGHYSLAVQLATNPGLAVSAAGLAVQLATNPGLSVGAAGLAVKLATNSGLAVDANGLYIPASFAGAGVTLTNGVLNVGAGAGITVNADDVALTTPGTLSWSTTNSSIGSHTHAMTAYSDASVYPQHLLKSDASGDVKLHMLVASDRVRTAIVDSPIGTSLSLQPAQDVLLSPGDTKRVKATTGVRLQSDGYVSQTTGWAIGFNGAADFRYLYTDELHAKAFIADLEQALAGGQIISKSVAPLSRDFTAPAEGGQTYIWVECFQGFPNVDVFQANDTVMVRSFDRSGGGLSIANCFGTVSAPYYPSPQSETPEQRWTFTRLSGTVNGQPAAGYMTTNSVVKAGALALDFGTSGMGYHEVNAIDGLMGENSPYAQSVKWNAHPWYDRTVVTRTGNLKGIFNVTNEYGLYAGTGVTDTDKFVRISNTAVEAHNLPVKLYDGSNVAVMLQPASEPYMAMGVPIPTGWMTQTGWWAGKSGGVYRQYLGTVSGGDIAAGLKWDGSTLTVKGQIFVTGGDAAKVDLSTTPANTVVDKVNEAGTLIQPGRIWVYGSTSLAGWRHPSDMTKIDGGNIYTGSITADKVFVTGQNLVANGGFELGNEGWTIGDGVASSYDGPRTGTYHYWAHGDAGTDYVATSIFIPVDGGRTYWLEGWIKIYAGSGIVGLLVHWYSAGKTWLSDSQLIGAASAVYKQYNRFVTAPGNACFAQVTLYKSGSLGTGSSVWWDDVVLRRASENMLVVGNPSAARVEINNSGIEGYSDATTKQFYLRTSDGRAMFGGGKGVLDSSGMVLDGTEDSFETYNSIRWLSQVDPPGGNTVARLYAGCMTSGYPSFWIEANPANTYNGSYARLISSALYNKASIISGAEKNGTAYVQICAEGSTGTRGAYFTVSSAGTDTSDYISMTTISGADFHFTKAGLTLSTDKLVIGSDGAFTFGSDSNPIRQPFVVRIWPLTPTELQQAATGFTASSWTTIGHAILWGSGALTSGMPAVPTGHNRRFYLSVNWADTCSSSMKVSLRIVKTSDSTVIGGPWDLPYTWADANYNNHILLGSFSSTNIDHWSLQYRLPSGGTFWPWDVTMQVVYETT